MRVYLRPPQFSRGLERIANALVRYAPSSVEVVGSANDADLVVIYAIGRRDAIAAKTAILLEGNRKYAIIQVCLRSTMAPSTQAWREIWGKAAVVWSYYDLAHAVVEDECGKEGQDEALEMHFNRTVNFYHAPLGADAEVFRDDTAVRKLFKIATSGGSRLQESVRECVMAAKEVNGHVFHVGKRSEWYPEVVYSDGCNDNELAASYQQCEFVSGLRRTEGFELPAVEGLLCGARPVLFNTDTYRRWYEPWGEFIEETDRQGVVEQLVQLFKRGARPVTATERAEAAMRFNWETIVRGFYELLK